MNFRILMTWILCWFATIANTSAHAYSVDDAVVVNMVKGGMADILSNIKAKPYYPLNKAYSGAHGELCLAGYAVMKVHHDMSNPVVRRGVQAALTFVKLLGGRQIRGYPTPDHDKTVYTVATAVLVLAEVNRKEYRPQLKKCESFLRARRASYGGYTYPGDHKGDISQTQYAVLALWTLDRAGIAVDYKGVQATISWLLRVQDPDGGWPYQGKDPGSTKRIKQGGVTPAMAVAGGSALMIAADILDVWGETMDEDETGIVGLPKAVKLFQDFVEDETASDKPTYDPVPIRKAIEDCQRYLGSSGNSPDPGKDQSAWPYYQLYTLERYESFREVIMGDDYRELAGWYDIGVNYLKSKEVKGKGWPGQTYTTSSVSSSFALLFLIRGTKKAIEQEAEGALAGGWTLPADTTKIRAEGGQIKGEPVAEAVTDLLDMLEGDDPSALEGKSLPEDMELPDEPKARRAQIGRLERLVRGSSSYQARRVAARVLGQSDEIRVVPSLIFALDDPDTRVRTYARDGLRFISRKFEGFGMKIERGKKQDYGELRRAQREWRNWYLTMDPGYVFLTQ